MIPLSVLDLAPITQGSNAAHAFQNTLDLAQHAEQWGYRRFWLAEHHGMPGVASAATAVIIGHVAGGTSRIRVGAGGIMLPNHAPLVIAEQFGTLASLYPGRIDLGLGRAPGTDRATTVALRRSVEKGADTFPQDVQELLGYFKPVQPGQTVQAVPGAGLEVPVWILGSSLFGAHLAAQLGLPYAFASHFAPDHLHQAIEIYRAHFHPSEYLQHPYVMAGLSVCAAETDAEAKRLFTSLQQQFLALRTGNPGQLPPPVDDLDAHWSPFVQASVLHALRYAVVGSAETVHRGLEAFVKETGVDEIMVTTQIFDHTARRRSFEIVAELIDQ